MQKVGGLLKAWRRDAKMSQEALAKHLGHQRPGTVQSWEKGRRTPKPKTIGKIADILGVSDADRRAALEALVGVTATGPRASGSPRVVVPPAPPRDPLVLELERLLTAGASRQIAEALIDVLAGRVGHPDVESTPARRRGHRG